MFDERGNDVLSEDFVDLQLNQVRGGVEEDVDGSKILRVKRKEVSNIQETIKNPYV